MEFVKLRVIIANSDVQDAIDELLELKKAADEKAMTVPVAILNEWLTNTLDWCKEQITALPSEKRYPDELNIVFRKYIQQ